MFNVSREEIRKLEDTLVVDDDTTNPFDVVKAKFWNYVIKRTENECWTWTGYYEKNGQARFTFDDIQLSLGRCIYYFTNAKHLKYGVIRHTCKNATCANPKHFEIRAK